MVPNGWKYQKLGAVAELQRGFDLPSQKRINGNVPIISSGGLSGYHNEAKVKSPGIVTGRYGSIGDVFYIQENFWPLNTSLWVRNFYGNDTKFIYFLLSSFDFKKFSGKTGVPGVNRNDLHAVKVYVPPLSEQQKIAKILSTWDKAICTTEALIDNSKQQKKALMQQLLTGKKRFAGFEGDWEEVHLKDTGINVIDGDRGKEYPKSTDFQSTGYCLFLSAKNVTKNGFKFSETVFVSEEKHKKLRKGLVKRGNLVLTTRGSVGQFAIFSDDVPFDTIRINSGMVVLDTSESKITSEFLFALAKSYLMKKQIDSAAFGSAQPQLTVKIINNLKLPIPLLPEQKKIAAVLINADKEINLLEQQLADLKQEKKALMQQLLTGKRRVKVDGVEAA